MTKRLITFLIAMSAVAAFADDAAILSKIKTANASYRTLESTFKEVKQLKANGKTTEKTGTIYFSASDKMAMHYKNDSEKFIINGTSVYVKRDGETKNYNTTKTKRVRNLVSTLICSVQGKIEELCETVSATSSCSEKGDSYVVVLNATKKSSKGYTKIELTYSKKDCVLSKMVTTENSGDVTTYTMSGTKKNLAVADSQFTIPKK